MENIRVEIIPVLDLLNGIAVHAIGGKRSQYKALETVFADSSEPVEIVKALPFEKLYVADLDAIMGKGNNFEILEELSRIKKVMADVGIKRLEDFEKINHIKMSVIVGTETLESPESFGGILKRYGEKTIISLDIKNDKTISSFLPEDPGEALKELRSLGAERIIILDITHVGSLKGFNPEYLKDLENLKKKDTLGMEIYIGGGIRKDDIPVLEKLGVKGVLVGTALHKGIWRV